MEPSERRQDGWTWQAATIRAIFLDGRPLCVDVDATGRGACFSWRWSYARGDIGNEHGCRQLRSSPRVSANFPDRSLHDAFPSSKVDRFKVQRAFCVLVSMSSSSSVSRVFIYYQLWLTV
jgi:hypothetical protein